MNRSRPIRVLHTEWSDGWGGQEIRIVEEMDALRRKGVELFLATRNEAKIAQKARERGFEVFTFPFRGNTDLKTLWGLYRLIRDKQIDIVNTHSGKDTWVGGIAAKMAGAKFIRTRHLSNPINPSRFNFINSLADFIITTGESVRKEMIRNNRIDPNKILSVPTGVDEKRFDPSCCDREEARNKFGIAPEQIAIGNLAVLRGFKRHDLFLEAAKEIHAKFPETVFLIAGEGPKRKRLETFIEENRMRSYVRLIGHVERPETFLRALDIFVLSSDSKEGVPQSIIQALMMRLPVIATDVGSVKDLYDENFLLVRPGSAEALHESIVELIQDEKKRETMRHYNGTILEKFTKTHMAQTIFEIYRQIL